MRFSWLLLPLLLACQGPKPPDTTCTDADADGHCAADDCDDNDPAIYVMGEVYLDSDGDQLGTGVAQQKCMAAGTPPRGYALQAGDCNDSKATCGTECIDADQDGVPQCADDCDDTKPGCAATCTDNDMDDHCSDQDCNELSGLHWADCGSCSDSDGDGRGAGCDLGADCGPIDPNNWDLCASCTDSDGDGSFVDCNQYVTRAGPDCDDQSRACQNDATCEDDDLDGVRVCAGDCDESGMCFVRALGIDSTAAQPSSDGGAFSVTGGTVELIGADAPLPTGAFTGSLPSASAATLHVRATDPPRQMTAGEISQTWDGVIVERGAILRLTGASGAVFTIAVTDHVYMMGEIESTVPEAEVVILPSGSTTIDATVGGTVSLLNSSAAGGTVLSLGQPTAKLRNVGLFGRIALVGADSGSDDGGRGGTLLVHASGEMVTNTDIDVRGGAGITPGSAGSVTFAAQTFRMRGEGVATTGGPAVGNNAGGGGGSVTLIADRLTAAASFFLTANGGSAGDGDGGTAGSIDIRVATAGNDTVTLPQLAASAGRSNSVGGDGGFISVRTGATGSVAGPSGDTITVQAPIEARGGIGSGTSGGNGGQVRLWVNDSGSTIVWNHPANVNGGSIDGNGGILSIGRVSGDNMPATGNTLPDTENSTLLLNASLSANGAAANGNGGLILLNVSQLTFAGNGALSADNGGGLCLVRGGSGATDVTDVTNDPLDVAQRVSDGTDADGTLGDLDRTDTAP